MSLNRRILSADVGSILETVTRKKTDDAGDKNVDCCTMPDDRDDSRPEDEDVGLDCATDA